MLWKPAIFDVEVSYFHTNFLISTIKHEPVVRTHLEVGAEADDALHVCTVVT